MLVRKLQPVLRDRNPLICTGFGLYLVQGKSKLKSRGYGLDRTLGTDVIATFAQSGGLQVSTGWGCNLGGSLLAEECQQQI